jgi:hypothetical protein
LCACACDTSKVLVRRPASGAWRCDAVRLVSGCSAATTHDKHSKVRRVCVLCVFFACACHALIVCMCHRDDVCRRQVTLTHACRQRCIAPHGASARCRLSSADAAVSSAGSANKNECCRLDGLRTKEVCKQSFFNHNRSSRIWPVRSVPRSPRTNAACARCAQADAQCLSCATSPALTS